jgi:hypothetical protein
MVNPYQQLKINSRYLRLGPPNAQATGPSTTVWRYLETVLVSARRLARVSALFLCLYFCAKSESISARLTGGGNAMKNNLDCLLEATLKEDRALRVLRKAAMGTSFGQRRGWERYLRLTALHQRRLARLCWFIAEIQRGRHGLPPRSSVLEN